MSLRSSKKRSHQTSWRSRGRQTSRFHAVALVFLFAFTGCSLFTTRDISQSHWENFQKLCFEGEGRGRVDTGEQKFVFTFESGWAQDSWILAADIPFKPQETLKLSGNESIRLSGTLAKRLASSLKQEEREAFLSFFTQWKKLVTLVEQSEKSCLIEGENCPFESPAWKVVKNEESDTFSLRLPLESNYLVHFDSSALNKTFFSHQKMALKNTKTSTKSDILKIELFYRECKK